jgi:hypothetical protein
MKTWKQFIFVTILAIFSLVGFIGCDMDNDNNDEKEGGEISAGQQGISANFAWEGIWNNGRSNIRIIKSTENIGGVNKNVATISGTQGPGWGQAGIVSGPVHPTFMLMKKMTAFSFTVLGDGHTYQVVFPTSDTDTEALDYNNYSAAFSTAKGETKTVTVMINSLRADTSRQYVGFNQNNLTNIHFLAESDANQNNQSLEFGLKIWDCEIHFSSNDYNEILKNRFVYKTPPSQQEVNTLLQTGNYPITFPIRGIALINGDDYNPNRSPPGEDSLRDTVRRWAEMGFNNINLNLASGITVDGNPPRRAINRINEGDFIEFCNLIHSYGMKITLHLYPSIENTRTGSGNVLEDVTVWPNNLELWMRQHTINMVEWARLAQRVNIEYLMVFVDPEQHLFYDQKNWGLLLNLISEVRKVYSGHLTCMFSTNGYNGIQEAYDKMGNVFTALDSIGICTPYLPATNKNEPSVDELVSAWTNNALGINAIEFMHDISLRYNKPILIVDNPFNSFAGANIDGRLIFDPAIPLAASQIEQANGIEAEIIALNNISEPWFLGMIFSSWNVHPVDYVHEYRFLNSPYGENIKGKLGERVLEKYFGQYRR